MDKTARLRCRRAVIFCVPAAAAAADFLSETHFGMADWVGVSGIIQGRSQAADLLATRVERGMAVTARQM